MRLARSASLRVVAVVSTGVLLLGCGSSGAGGNAGVPAGPGDTSPLPSGPASSSGGVGGSGGGGAGGDAPGDDGGAAGGAGDAGTGPGAQAFCVGLKTQALDADRTVQSGGMARVAHVHVPASYDPTRPTPVVLDFHGYTSNGTEQIVLTGMNTKADAEGFIAVHPEGYMSSWNAGACCGQAASMNLDDVQFVRDLLDSLETDLCVDRKRVFSTGMSNGGFLSHRLGCEMSDRIAAIAPVAGVLGVPTCTPTRPVPVMEFHGTADPLVPYDGDPSQNFPSVPATFAGWSSRDACTGSPTQTYSKVDSSCSTYAQCASGATVTLCTIQNGGHEWPGGLPVPALGYTTTNLSATDAMWDFFTKNPMP